MAREIIHSGLVHEEFIHHATTGYEEFKEHVEPWTLEFTSEITGVPSEAIADLAHGYAKAPTAQILWTLGITEHHTGVDNVLALSNLALLTGHVGRPGSGLVPLRGQNNVQGGGDMGALPNKLPGFQDVDNDEIRSKFEQAWGAKFTGEIGLNLTQMFEAMGQDKLKAVWVIGENPADSEADVKHAREMLKRLDMLVVQDVFMTRTAKMADVVFPAALGWAESEGTATSSERRVQRIRAAVPPPGQAKQEVEIISENGPTDGINKLGATHTRRVMGRTTNSFTHACRDVLEALRTRGGIQWPCPDEDHPGSPFLHGRLWERPVEGRRAPFSCVEHRPPVDELTDEFPIRLTTGRVLDSYNTGVQTDKFDSPIRSGDALEISSEDSLKLGVEEGETVKVSSRRGSILMRIEIDEDLQTGLAFTTFHFSRTG